MNLFFYKTKLEITTHRRTAKEEGKEGKLWRKHTLASGEHTQAPDMKNCLMIFRHISLGFGFGENKHANIS
jgi:hypothetical protein